MKERTDDRLQGLSGSDLKTYASTIAVRLKDRIKNVEIGIELVAPSVGAGTDLGLCHVEIRRIAISHLVVPR